VRSLAAALGFANGVRMCLVAHGHALRCPHGRDTPARTIARRLARGHDQPVSTADPQTGAAEPVGRRNRWIWLSAALAVVAVGLLIWGLVTQSDLESTKQELAGTQDQLDSTEQELTSAQQDVEEMQAEGDDGVNAGVLAAAGALYKRFAEQLDATQEDLAATQQDLEEAQRAATQADDDAAAAAQRAAEADSQTGKAQAQADQATAEAKAAEARAAMAVDCAKAFVTALGGVFEGDDVDEQAEVVREQLDGIVADCEEQLAEGE
jgi:hypothetical protein